MQNRLNTEKVDTPRRQVKVPISSIYEMPYSWRSWRGFWGNIRYLFTRRKYIKQRGRLGYCDLDVWNCGDHIIEQMLVMLTEYRNTTKCWPDQYFTTFEEWIAHIDEIIDLLEFALLDTEENNQFYPAWKETWEWTKEQKDTREYTEIFDKYCTEVNRLYKAQIAAREEAFALLAPYIHLIWW